MTTFRLKGLLLLFSFFLVSCGEKAEEKIVTKQDIKPILRLNISPVEYSKGQKLYLNNCALCHGKNAEGAKNWRQPDESGKNPAPPLNGSGHTWHHSNKALTLVINRGTAKIGGNMPAWKDRLSNNEIKLILTWIIAQWPDEVYAAWYNRFHQK